jgi:hypothetical protein
MIDNTTLLDNLLAQGLIRVRDCALLHSSPSALPLDFDFSKIEGMLPGVAVGDALGATSEGMSPPDRQKQYGEIFKLILVARKIFWG